MPAHINIIERIERHASELRDDECWVTDYIPGNWGYVYLSNRAPSKVPLHRIAWEAHNAQPLPEGMVLMHTCDNPACFNPQHLIPGTQSQNIRDCVAKGRFSCNNAPVGKGSRPRT